MFGILRCLAPGSPFAEGGPSFVMDKDPTKFCERCGGTTVVMPRRIGPRSVLLCRACRSLLKGIRAHLGKKHPRLT